MTIWAHPIDVHYTLKGIDGWPRLQLEIFGVDGFGRNELGAQHAAVPAPWAVGARSPDARALPQWGMGCACS